MKLLFKESEFFHFIAPIVRKLVTENAKDIQIAKHKRVGDYATEVDVAVENLIVAELRKRFPDDEILAEEGHAASTISKKRIWIIDPICGTSNLARGIKNFCTNIALAENGILIASCVVDHSQDTYFWSVGNGVYTSNEKVDTTREDLGIVIDVDFGSIAARDIEQKGHFARFLGNVLTKTDYGIVSLNSSLSFAYAAIGKLDGFFNTHNHPWDIAASGFLIQQSGGIITSITGEPWTLSVTGAIAARNKEVHQKLLELYTGS